MPAEITSTVVSATPEIIDHLSRTADILLAALDHDASELDVSLVSDDEIARLNAEYRHKAKPTDVLSFPQLEGETAIATDDDVHLGDVVISIDTASRQAAEGGWTVEEEVARLLLHGLLHLLGFDHEQGGEEEARMTAEEDRLVSVLEAAGIGCAHRQPGTPS